MIFQGGIDLELENRDVQAIIDFDTGLIGFTEIIDQNAREYLYHGSPKEFKVALLEKLKPILEERCHINMKVSRKSEAYGQWMQVLEERK